MAPRRPDCGKWAPRQRQAGFKVSPFRISQMSDAIFSKVDSNKDGVLDRAEFGKLVAVVAACHNRPVKMGKPARPARPMAPAQPCPGMSCPR